MGCKQSSVQSPPEKNGLSLKGISPEIRVRTLMILTHFTWVVVSSRDPHWKVRFRKKKKAALCGKLDLGNCREEIYWLKFKRTIVWSMTSTTCGNRKLSKVKKRQQHLPTKNFAPDRQNRSDKSSGKATDFLAGRISKSFWITVCHLLVGGWALALWKIWNSVGMLTFPNIWKNKKCSKPPTSLHSPHFAVHWAVSSGLETSSGQDTKCLMCTFSISCALRLQSFGPKSKMVTCFFRNHWILSTNHLPQWKKYSPLKKKAELYWMHSFWAAFWDFSQKEWGTSEPHTEQKR